MKLRFVYTGLLATTFTILSCNKFLDKLPDNRTSLNSVDKVAELLTTAYPSASYIPFLEAMSDNADDKGEGRVDFNQENSDAYRFKDIIKDAQDTPEYYWMQAYAAIAAANQALDAIAKAPDPDEYAAQKGEALVCRAFAHFMLVTLFAKVYDPATAANDPGIPYVTEPETVVFKDYSRGTVQEDYDKIEKDLEEGLPLLAGHEYDVPKYHFTTQSANAFASRFYLFKRDYVKVVEAAKAAFPTGNFVKNMRPWLTTYSNLSYDEMRAIYTKSSENANLLLIQASSWWDRNFASMRFGLSDALSSKILGNNVTGNRSWAMPIFGQSDYHNVPKWSYFFYAPEDPNFGQDYSMIPQFTTEEVLLNRAEAYARLDQFDNCINDLNTYASQRFENYNPTSNAVTVEKAETFYDEADPTQALVNVVLDFKRAEFVEEGQRWFDIIRNGLTVKHYIRNTRQVIVDSVIVAPDDPRRVLQIPQSAVLSGVELNPR
ncbi:RagB/SusD family nutrient uptake outer membrane protein [Arachidicoccus terrestris]|uniref:RagB/SusD family nutrient uptake outer membrane protein n=1 Tax=Arachidicoccus terrestris TaxID=2875539 RepID=UPI001CC3B0B4|nr:RagB/SusD family nutrient uptake outer membrane protein [Arachidicoccus terrestris]UAY56386.1 RagB/SusD family nutrient uptake outer membrane protein [Arachidicoccus terrestris]